MRTLSLQLANPRSYRSNRLPSYQDRTAEVWMSRSGGAGNDPSVTLVIDLGERDQRVRLNATTLHALHEALVEFERQLAERDAEVRR